MAKKYMYLPNPGRLRDFLEKIQEVGVPSKLTLKVLQGMGFKSTNDRPLISAMKSLGFLSGSGEPTDRWQSYRDTGQAGAVLGQAIKEHYAELYQMYPDAHLKDTEALRNFFSTHTTVAAGTLNFIIMTFKTAASLANFDVPPSDSVIQTPTGFPKDKSPKPQPFQTGMGGFAININIQLTLPEGSSSDTFEEFFKAMRKHLLEPK